jgi:hypothetical protein
MPIQCAEEREFAGKMWKNAAALLALQHAGGDFALRQADIDASSPPERPRPVSRCAVLVGDDRVAALQDLERAELGEMSDQRIQRPVRPRQAQMNQLGGGVSAVSSLRRVLGEAQTQIQPAQPAVSSSRRLRRASGGQARPRIR